MIELKVTKEDDLLIYSWLSAGAPLPSETKQKETKRLVINGYI